MCVCKIYIEREHIVFMVVCKIYRERERVCVWLCVYECACVSKIERERESVLSVFKQECVCECVIDREREIEIDGRRERKSVHVLEGVCVCLCVCVKNR